jgi:hypothetical protein
MNLTSVKNRLNESEIWRSKSCSKNWEITAPKWNKFNFGTGFVCYFCPKIDKYSILGQNRLKNRAGVNQHA